MTTVIIKSASILVIEDLNVSGLLRNHRLALSLSDASLAEIYRQIEYKAKWYGAELRKADRFYPSSKRCSRCGSVKMLLGLGERVYRCENAACGFVMDRDLNASINLKLAGSSPASACCPGSAGHGRKTATKLLVGQEPSRKESVC
jgi:putative transposase